MDTQSPGPADEDDAIDLPGQSDSSKNLKKRTRPPKEIDVEKLKEFLAVNMPVRRIAHFFNCTPETLYNKYRDLIIESNVDFEYQIRLAQLKAANELNPTMLIWLGKQVLGQSDEQKVTVEQKPSVSDIVFVPLKKEE